MLLTKMVIEIKNAVLQRKAFANVKINNLCLVTLTKLRKLHYIDFYSIEKSRQGLRAKIYLRYSKNKSVIKSLKNISTSKKKKFFTVKKLLEMRNMYPCIGIFSTSKGIYTHIECLEHNIGGILLFFII